MKWGIFSAAVALTAGLMLYFGFHGDQPKYLQQPPVAVELLNAEIDGPPANEVAIYFDAIDKGAIASSPTCTLYFKWVAAGTIDVLTPIPVGGYGTEGITAAAP